MNPRFYIGLLGLSVLAALPACKKQDLSPNLTSNASESEKANWFYGPAQRIGNGVVRTFSVIDHNGDIREMGVELTAGVLNGLPAPLPEPANGPEYSWSLDLHQKGRALTPFNHVEFDWNPVGHFPPGIYDKPHFDLHFYKISKEEQMAIPEYNAETAALHDNPPPPGYLPLAYGGGPGGVAMMGRHWIDFMAPEFNGGTFTHTMIYGSYNGKVIFLEPMITKEFLEGLSGEETAVIRQPQFYDPVNTNYPHGYKISKDPKSGNIYISLTDFSWVE